MGRLSIIVIGSAAGGGFPQWNCACDVCRLAWAGDPRVKVRTQASLAVTAGALPHVSVARSRGKLDADRNPVFLRRSSVEATSAGAASLEGASASVWAADASPAEAGLVAGRAVSGAGHTGGIGQSFVLINASPDLRAQLLATPALQPRGLRDSPVAAVVLTGAEVDQTAGLLTLRERGGFTLFGTASTLATLAGNPIFNVLAVDVVTRETIRPGTSFDLPGGIAGELFLVPGKAPLYLEGDNPQLATETEANVGIELSAGGARLVFIPGAAKLTEAITERLRDADVVLFDGTLFDDDEMIASGTGVKTGRRMGHMPVGGPDGTLAALAGLGRRRILIHINNTNPILIEGSAQRRSVEAAGFEVAEDGMRIEL